MPYEIVIPDKIQRIVVVGFKHKNELN